MVIVTHPVYDVKTHPDAIYYMHVKNKIINIGADDPLTNLETTHVTWIELDGHNLIRSSPFSLETVVSIPGTDIQYTFP